MLDVGSTENENNRKFIEEIRDELGITDVSTAMKNVRIEHLERMPGSRETEDA
jgi:hypothetical protein